jgi:hypothetical protein
MSLEAAVSASCGNYSFDFNGRELTALQIVDLFAYKFNISCLEDLATKAFCLVLEESWNITALNDSGEATWPLYTNKTYPNWIENDDGFPLVDENDTIIASPFDPPPDFQWLNFTDLEWAGKYYFISVSEPIFQLGNYRYARIRRVSIRNPM